MDDEADSDGNETIALGESDKEVVEADAEVQIESGEGESVTVQESQELIPLPKSLPAPGLLDQYPFAMDDEEVVPASSGSEPISEGEFDDIVKNGEPEVKHETETAWLSK